MAKSKLADVISAHEGELLSEWIQMQMRTSQRGIGEDSVRSWSRGFLAALREGTLTGDVGDITRAEWGRVREMLSDLSRSRAEKGFSPTETASMIFSLKEPLFSRLRTQFGTDSHLLTEEIRAATRLVDQLGLFTMESYQKSREQLITRQQQDMLELSTPVVRLWDGVVALPLIGTLDSARTQVVMENLLEAIVNTSAAIAIIDITGVPTVDTLVAQHLLKTVAAARLMGAECIISGIRPQIAQTIIHLGVELTDVITKATLADAFQLALRRLGLTVTRQTKS